jgi:malonate-semialdehyde dehydrogenase (acetylating)/methylmalonate-semialdehyde dehydrogenase
MNMEIRRVKNFINGEWKISRSKETMIISNPATGEIISEVAMSLEAEVNDAVLAAYEAFHEWRRTPVVRRARYLFQLKELLEENFEELSVIQTKEHGKTIDESRGETRRGIENVEVAMGMPTLMMGEALQDIASGIDSHIVREPLGVFSCIAPFNFPFMIPLWFMPYAVAAGNTFIVKASEYVPNSQEKLFELIEEADFPPGVINLIHGCKDVANMLIDHEQVEGITFVGSTPVAKQVYKRCGEAGKRVIAQGGAKNYLVVMPDAKLDQTIAAFMTSFFGNTGQRCLSGANALIVGKDDRFYESFVDAFVEAAKKIRVGNGLEETTQMGPLQAEFRKKRVLGYIDQGVQEGAGLILDGRQVKTDGGLPDTCFLGPTVFNHVTPGMTIAKEEIFGPVACVLRADDFSNAIDMVNALPFGNASSIFTSSGKTARDFAQGIDAGNIGINIGIAAPMAFFPFSGMKDSFFGVLHGQGKDAVRFFTESKVIIERWF